VHKKWDGDLTINCNSAISTAGENQITSDKDGSCIELVAIEYGGVRRWRVVGRDGMNLGTQ